MCRDIEQENSTYICLKLNSGMSLMAAANKDVKVKSKICTLEIPLISFLLTNLQIKFEEIKKGVK